MYTLISILLVITAACLVFIVVIQNSKGGGLASGFSSSNQVMGVRKTTDFLEKATWYLAGFLVVLCMLSPVVASKNVKVKDSEIKENIQNAVPVDPNAVSPFGTPATQQQGQQQPQGQPQQGQQQQQPAAQQPQQQAPKK